jgi:hypothetical protein
MRSEACRMLNRFMVLLGLLLGLRGYVFAEDIVVEFEPGGLRQVVVQPANTITWVTENGGHPQIIFDPNKNPCTVNTDPGHGQCVIDSKVGEYPYSYAGCSTPCQHSIRVRKNASDDGSDENYLTPTVTMELPSAGGEMDLRAYPDDTVHFRHPKLKTKLDVHFMEEGDTADPCAWGFLPATTTKIARSRVKALAITISHCARTTGATASIRHCTWSRAHRGQLCKRKAAANQQLQ